MGSLVALVLCCSSAASVLSAQDGARVGETPAACSAAPLRYVLRFPEHTTHRMDMELVVPVERVGPVELFLPTWTPGSYLIREYARHVEGVAATAPDGRALSIEKVGTNRWRVDPQGAGELRVRYRVYGRELTVRTNWIERDLAFLNGAATFITLVEPGPRPHDVRIELAPGWRRAVTALPPHPDGAALHHRAPDLDTLIDCPIILGNPEVHEFTVRGVPHALVNFGDPALWDGARAAQDVARIVEEQVELWGALPYDRYLFLNGILEASGGLEHLGSTLVLTSRWTFRNPRAYQDWLGLISHELFHAWNGKRLRPVTLGPFDYEQERLTPDLWVVEGITSYYDDLLVARAGLVDEKEYLRRFSKNLESVQKAPGRRVRSLAEASIDAWIKHYRPDENSANSTISYYTKGALVAFLLDQHLRRLTDGARSLDDVLRLAGARFSGTRGYESAEFEAVVSEVAGEDLTAWFDHAVRGTNELDYAPALAALGLRFQARRTTPEEPAPDASAWLGLELREEGGRVLVRRVLQDTPAHAGGLNAEDEILAVGGYRLQVGEWKERRRQHRVGERVGVLVARRGSLVELELTFAAEPTETWLLEPDPAADEAAQLARARWLGPSVAQARWNPTVDGAANGGDGRPGASATDGADEADSANSVGSAHGADAPDVTDRAADSADGTGNAGSTGNASSTDNADGTDNADTSRTPDTFTQTTRGRPPPALPVATELERRRQLAAARSDLAQHPHAPEAWIWYGRRLAYLGLYPEAIRTYSTALERFPDEPRLYRHRGHRHLTLRDTNRALADLSRAAQLIEETSDAIEPDGLPNAAGVALSTTHYNVYYHLALAQFLTGDLEAAHASWQRCLALARHDDTRVAAAAWLVMTLERLERGAETGPLLAATAGPLTLHENHDYQALLRLHRGETTPEELLAEAHASDEAVRFATLGHGIGRYLAARGRHAEARALWREVTASPQQAAFGVLAAEQALRASP